MSQDILSPLSTDTPEARHRHWRERRFEELSAAESWLGLAGLYWLEPGTNAVGSAPDCAVVLPAGPARLGDLLWEGPSVRWRPFPGGGAVVEGMAAGADGEVVLATDRAGAPTRVRYGDLLFFVIERDGRLAVRLRDLDWRTKDDFAGVDCYPFDPDWCVEALWDELVEPVSLQVQNGAGNLTAVNVSARAVFRVDGKEFALLPLGEGEDHVFFVFRDTSSGRETYGGGRFLKAVPPVDKRLVLDFNRAFNPPCAFTAFATCSLPPQENWLPFPVQAGEKKYAGSH
ncbi:MAG: hypothetical protein H6R10_849 [Rhodocyclaceae bacterium]|nr:hypothetical protein [Rhodocyclaceae bacterium]